jgi:hypothetical protein
MGRILFSVVMLIAFASSVDAQFSTYPRTTEPAYWLSGGVGTFNAQRVHDGGSNSTWDFGQKTSWQWRASIEKAIQNQSSIGIVGSFAHVPFTYQDNRVYNIPNAAGCPISGCTPITDRCTCAAHLDVMSLAAQFHAGGGTGFHQVIQIAIGATAYRNLKSDAGMKLDPAGGDLDGSFSLGYGFGYGLSSNSEITLVPDYALILHQSTGLPSGTSNTNTIRSIRMALRYGFGARHPGVRRR